MHWFTFLVSTLVILFAARETTADTRLSDTNSPTATVPPAARSGHLNTGNKNHVVINLDDEDEERGGLISLLKDATTEASKSIGRSIKSQYWIEVRRTDDQVKKALKLDGLTGHALKSHKNYKTYNAFMYKLEGRQLDELVRKIVSTYSVWESLRLNRFPTDKVKSTEEYRIYARYVNKYDNRAIAWKDMMWEPKRFHHGSPSPQELMVKTEIWAQAGRKQSYEKEMLGLRGLEGSSLKDAANYKFLKRFEELTRKRKSERFRGFLSK